MKHTHISPRPSRSRPAAAPSDRTRPTAIVYALAEKIKSGELKPGDRVPSVTELVESTTSAPARPDGHKPS